MATLRYSIPGPGGSLGMCAVCGESFVYEVLTGQSIGGMKVSGIDASLPVHSKCGDAVEALQGPWAEIRATFPKGPMFDCFEEEFKSSGE